MMCLNLMTCAILLTPADCPIASVSTYESASEYVSPPSSLKLKPHSDSLKYSFPRPDESLSIIIASDLN